LLFKEYKSLRVYAFNQGRYKLANSTLFNNYSALNLVNKISKLKLSTFIKVTKIETVESGSSNLPILSYGTYVLRGILNRASSSSKRDLVLNNIAIIKGFYTNIVSKSKLLLAGV
jgi:hypothetical protein